MLWGSPRLYRVIASYHNIMISTPNKKKELIDKAKLKRNRTQKYLRAMRLLVAPTTSEGNGVGGGGRVAFCRGAGIPILNTGGTQCGM